MEPPLGWRSRPFNGCRIRRFATLRGKPAEQRRMRDEVVRIARVAMTVVRVRIGSARIKYAQVTSARSMSAMTNAAIIAVIVAVIIAVIIDG